MEQANDTQYSPDDARDSTHTDQHISTFPPDETGLPSSTTCDVGTQQKDEWAHLKLDEQFLRECAGTLNSDKTQLRAHCHELARLLRDVLWEQRNVDGQQLRYSLEHFRKGGEDRPINDNYGHMSAVAAAALNFLSLRDEHVANHSQAQVPSDSAVSPVKDARLKDARATLESTRTGPPSHAESPAVCTLPLAISPPSLEAPRLSHASASARIKSGNKALSWRMKLRGRDRSHQQQQ